MHKSVSALCNINKHHLQLIFQFLIKKFFYFFCCELFWRNMTNLMNLNNYPVSQWCVKCMHNINIVKILNLYKTLLCVMKTPWRKSHNIVRCNRQQYFCCSFPPLYLRYLIIGWYGYWCNEWSIKIKLNFHQSIGGACTWSCRVRSLIIMLQRCVNPARTAIVQGVK